MNGPILGPWMTVYVNIHVLPTGRLWVFGIAGDKHTYLKVEESRFPTPQDNQGHSRSAVTHKFVVNKLGDASVEVLGDIGVNDEVLVTGGRLIINGTFRWTAARDKGLMEIFDGGTVELQSGARMGPFFHSTHFYKFHLNVYRNGTLQAGSPDRPLTRDAFVLLGFADHAGHRPGYSGMFAARGSNLRVFTADPRQARLVFSSLTAFPDIYGPRGEVMGDPGVPASGSRGIHLQLGFAPDQYRSVRFDYVAEGGLKIPDPAHSDARAPCRAPRSPSSAASSCPALDRPRRTLGAAPCAQTPTILSEPANTSACKSRSAIATAGSPAGKPYSR